MCWLGKKGVEITWEACAQKFYWIEPDSPYFGGCVRKNSCEREKDHEGNHSLVWPADQRALAHEDSP